MFDRVIVARGRTETRFVTREVHEHRAPTDESVRLLGEMQAKAEADRAARLPLESNLLSGEVEWYLDAPADCLKAVAHVKINGQVLTVRAEGRDADELAKDVRDKLAERIATSLIVPALARAKLPRNRP